LAPLLALGLLCTFAGLACSKDAPSPYSPDPAISTLRVAYGGFFFDARVAGPEGGEVVLLLHGFPESSYEWRSQLKALGAAGYRAVAFDQRGYSPGARPDGVANYDILLLAQDVIGVADAIGAQRFHLIGHDWGGAIAWVVARFAAARVISLEVLSIPHPDPLNQLEADPSSCQYTASAYWDPLSLVDAADRLVADDYAYMRYILRGLPEDNINVYVRALGDSSTLTAMCLWYRKNIANRQFQAPAIGSITVPTLFAWGADDPDFCRTGVDMTAGFVSAPYQLEILDGVDHWVPENGGERINELLVGHVSAYH
jgi:pimeloyl-ACP methyl ester carboxylesterase